MARPIGIRVFQNDEQIDVQIFDREIIKIGRLASAHLRLDDPKVSRIHAVIDIAAGTDDVSIIDMGSSEGTRVNGESVSRAQLNHDDEITLGDTRLVVLLEQAALGELVSEHAALMGDGQIELEPEADSDARDPTRVGDLQVDTAIREALADLDVPSQQTSVFENTFEAGDDDDADPSLSDAFFSSEPANNSTPPQAVESAPVQNVRAQPSSILTAPAPSGPQLRPQQVAPRAPNPTQPPHSALAPIPEDPIHNENRFLEVSLTWGGDVVEMKRLREEESFTIGSGEDDLFVPLDGVSHDSSFVLAERAKGTNDWNVRFTRKMGGTLTQGDNITPLAQVNAVPDGDAQTLMMNDDMHLRLDIGYFTLNIKPVSQSRAIPLPAILDTMFINTALATMFATLSMLALLLLYPVDTDVIDDDLLTNAAEFQTLILKEKKPDKSLIDRLKGKKAEGTAAKKDRGKMGKKKEKNKDGKATFKKKDKPTDEQVVSSKMQALFGGKNGGVAAIFGADSGGSDLQTFLGNMSGSSAASASGEGGLSFRGSGPGGSGTGDGTIGLGSVGTRGRGSGDSGYGSGEGGIGKKRDKDVRVSTGNPIIYGSLDKEIIRRIVREHQGEIRYCYTKELARNPGLGGKISMKWVIDGSGRVKSAKVANSQMKSKSVERCIASRIRRWKFPKPKGGGIVVVTYPFVFKKG